MPTILKGWVGRVFAFGRLYGNGRWYDRGVLAERRAMVSMTVGGPRSMGGQSGLIDETGQFLFPIQHGISRSVGFDVLPPFNA